MLQEISDLSKKSAAEKHLRAAQISVYLRRNFARDLR
jgi:hypothetical protein